MGNLISWLGVSVLIAFDLQDWPVVMLMGLVLVAAVTNLFIGGMLAKWMLFGPLVIPLFYQINPALTPDIISAAYRVGSCSTDVVAPMMTYTGVILSFMRKYDPSINLGELMALMWPYALVFLLLWPSLLVAFYIRGWPLGV